MYQRGSKGVLQTHSSKAHYTMGAGRYGHDMHFPAGTNSSSLLGWWWRCCCWFRPKSWRAILGGFACAVVVVTLFRIPELARDGISGRGDRNARPVLCDWRQGDPTLYHLKTKLGVNYEASHWFHMAENFLTQHSILAAQHKQTNASRVYFSFDNAAFVPQLSAVTRMIVALGTLAAAAGSGSDASSTDLHYVHLDESTQHWFGQSASMASTALSPGQAFLLQPTSLTQQTVIKSNQQVPLGNRFKEAKDKSVYPAAAAAAEVDVSQKNASCVKFIDTIGGNWPTPQRGHWFPNTGDIDSFRDKIRLWCGGGSNVGKNAVDTTKQKKHKLVIYQRDLSRKLANELEALGLLGVVLPANQWEIKVLMHSKDRSPCQLAQALKDTDVLLTPHGFQSMLLLMLPRPALIFEVFPYRYYKRGYGPLSKEYGILHAGVMSPPLTWHTRLSLALVSTAYCMLGKQCRNYARSDNVHLTKHGVNRLLAAINNQLLPALSKAGERRDVLIA